MAGRNMIFDETTAISDVFTQTPPEEDMYATVPVHEVVMPQPTATPASTVVETAGYETEPEDMIEVEGSRVEQTVGWLVCIKGKCKGKDFRLHSGFNYIGSGKDMDICIQDPKVSKKMITIAFDSLNRSFTIMRCEGTKNIARCNNKPLYMPVELNIYDKVTVGDTDLLFVPLCCEKFGWEEDEEA